MVSVIQDLKVVHHTNEAKSRFISLAPSVGNDNISINKPLNSQLMKSLRTDGPNHNYIAKPSGDGSKNPSTNGQELKKQNEDLKRRVRPMGTNTS